MVDVMLTNKEGHTGDMMAEGSLSYRDHDMVELKTQSAVTRVKSKLTTLNSRTSRCDHLGILEESRGITAWSEE